MGYASLWHHQASGLDLATYRAYDAASKRWISRDPLGEGVDYNLYRYCGNSPIGHVDPMGLEAGILGSDGVYHHYAGTAEGWSDFITDLSNAQAGSINEVYIFGHGGPTGIYPQRFPVDDTKNSYIWFNEATGQLRVGYTKNGRHYDIPFSDLKLDKKKMAFGEQRNRKLI